MPGEARNTEKDMREAQWVIGVFSVWLMSWGQCGFSQGSLSPAGAPAESMKTLAQVEPRTPISSAPYTITQSGSYYLTTNLNSSGHGVVVQADRVTLDLMGFALTGDRGAGEYGVWLAGTTNALLRDIVVRGGMVSGFGSGVRLDSVQGCRVDGLTISSNSSHGILLDATRSRCEGNMFAGCFVAGNGAHGVYFESYFGTCIGNMVRNCNIIGNGGIGVNVDGSSSAMCDDNTIADSSVITNGAEGIYLNGQLGRCNGNAIRNCTVSRNATYGIRLDGFLGQCNGNVVEDCILRMNKNYGIMSDRGNANRIENNHITGSGIPGMPDYGLVTILTSDNLIFRNTCVGQATNFVICVDDIYGPIVTNRGKLDTTNGAAALSPWANFSR